jgi:hypothetical protein
VHDLSILNMDTKETSLLTLSALFQSNQLTVSSMTPTSSCTSPGILSLNSQAPCEPLRVTRTAQRGAEGGGEKGPNDALPNGSISIYSIKYPKKSENLGEELLNNEQRRDTICSMVVENNYMRGGRLLPVSNLPIAAYIGIVICIIIV